MKEHRSPAAQGGGFLIGLVVGLLIGLAAALGVALYVTKAPNPFVNKVPARSSTQDAAETERNRNWDPNGALAGRNPAPGAAASGAVTGADPTLPATRPALVPPTVIDPVLPAAPDGTRTARPGAAPASGAAVAQVPGPAPRASQAVASAVGAAPFTYFVQAGAYSRTEDAEQQRAKLAMLGVESRLTEREQGGRMVYRVRVGPFDRREDAESAKEKLGDSGVDSALVAVQK
jgi:cell division protein FtsN